MSCEDGGSQVRKDFKVSECSEGVSACARLELVVNGVSGGLIVVSCCFPITKCE